MAKIKYNCTDCGNKFIGDDFTTDCNNCNSSNLEISKDTGKGPGIIDWIKENKKAFYILSAIILILILFSKSCPKKTEFYVWKVQQPTGMSYIEITLWKEDENGIKIKIKNQDVINILGKKIIVNGAPINIQDLNKVYLCEDMPPGYIEVRLYRKLYDTTYYKLKPPINVSIDLTGIKADPKAVCPPSIESSDIDVRSNSNCELIVKILKNLNGVEPFISVYGKNGPYEKKSVWDLKTLPNLKTIDVWVYLDGQDPSLAKSCLINGNSITKAGCVSIDPMTIIAEFTPLANAYGNNPSKGDEMDSFLKYLDSHSISPTIFLDNINVTLSSLLVETHRKHINNGALFVLSGSIDVNKQGLITSFKFKTK